MQITESIIERIARRVFNSLFPGALRQSGAIIGGSGSSVSYASEAGHASTADAVPWTGVTGAPATATRWPTWSEVTSKPSFATVATSGSYNDLSNRPSIPSVSGSVSGSTLTITINGTNYSLTDTNTWRPIQNNLSSTATDESLSAYMGYLLARGSARDDSKLPLTGGTITGNLTVNQTFTCQNVEIGHTNEVNATGSDTLYLQYRNSGNLCLCYNGHNVGIGTNSPSYKLHVAGTIYCTGGFTFLSDIRKKDVETYHWSPTLDMIADAPIIRYTMKDDETHRTRVGSVAQYWQKVMPETVTETDDTLSMDGTTIALTSVIALAREVKKQKIQIDRLMQQIYGY